MRGAPTCTSATSSRLAWGGCAAPGPPPGAPPPAAASAFTSSAAAVSTSSITRRRRRCSTCTSAQGLCALRCRQKPEGHQRVMQAIQANFTRHGPIKATSSRRAEEFSRALGCGGDEEGAAARLFAGRPQVAHEPRRQREPVRGLQRAAVHQRQQAAGGRRGEARGRREGRQRVPLQQQREAFRLLRRGAPGGAVLARARSRCPHV